MSERTVTLIGADGSRHVLACSDEPYQLGTNAELWGIGSWQVASRALGTLPGRRLDFVRAGARTVVVPVVIEATEGAQDALLGDLARVLSPAAGDCRVVYRRPDGTERELTARYTGGGNAVTVRTNMQRAVKVPIMLEALHPFWRDTSGPEQTEAETYLGSGLKNTLTVDEQGDVDAWPEITIVGPAQNVEMANLTTGQVVRLTEIVTAGQVVRIETNPETVGIWTDDAATIGSLDVTSELWPLKPGLNYLVFSAAAVGGDIGSFSLRWASEYDSC